MPQLASNSEWKLRWNFNVLIFLGLVGINTICRVIASHSCMRLLEEDALDVFLGRTMDFR